MKNISIVLLMSCLIVRAQVAQQPAAHAGHSTTKSVAVLIDGSVNPELISDEEAAKVLLISLMMPANATEAQQGEQEAKLNPIALSAQDQQALVAILAQFHAGFTSLMNEAQEANDSSILSDGQKSQTVHDKVIEGDDLCSTTWSQTLLSVGSKGRAKLQDYLGNVKRHMKIIPPPVMQ